MRQLFIVAGLLTVGLPCCAQDVSPLRGRHVWLPMTGVTESQMDDASAAGYDTILIKAHPPLEQDSLRVDFTATDKLVAQAKDKGFHIIMAVLGWVGLGDGLFWDTKESGERIPNRLDPFWPEAMDRIEWYFGQVIEHYRTDERIVAFAPTWGIYGEAGFTSFDAGRSTHALARFNEWLERQGLSAVDSIPTLASGPNTDYNRFIRFRYLYVEDAFDAMVTRLKDRAGGIPVGMWQELYPVMGYLWTMVEVPSADFCLYESGFPFQTCHHPEKSLAETMGFRYRCASADDYRDYYLPLLARKRGEGGAFMGCQLTNDYAVNNYGWSAERAQEVAFDRWEDEFSPYLKELLDTPLESPNRDVLLVFPTYAAAALSQHPRHACDIVIIDVLLRSYGCQMVRYASTRLDKMSVEEMDSFRLIVVPEAAYLMSDTYEKLKRTKARVLFTGCFAQAVNGGQTAFGDSREFDGLRLGYFVRSSGAVTVASGHSLVSRLKPLLQELPVNLPDDEAFRYDSDAPDVRILLKCGDDPLLSIRDHMIFIHGHLFASACFNPARKPPVLSGSKDPSANEHDMWGPYDSSHPQNVFGVALMGAILDWAGVDCRVRNPLPRILSAYLGDHIEQASISANLAYNNTDKAQTLTVRLPWKPAGRDCRVVDGRFETEIIIPPFSYIALQPVSTEAADR